jgi:hypothetical protein
VSKKSVVSTTSSTKTTSSPTQTALSQEDKQQAEDFSQLFSN